MRICYQADDSRTNRSLDHPGPETEGPVHPAHKGPVGVASEKALRSRRVRCLQCAVEWRGWMRKSSREDDERILSCDFQVAL